MTKNSRITQFPTTTPKPLVGSLHEQLSNMTDIERRMHLAILRLTRYTEWLLKDGALNAIAESYIQKFTTHADVAALHSLVVEKLGITEDEIALRAVEEIEKTISLIQLNAHVILTPDGVLQER